MSPRVYRKDSEMSGERLHLMLKVTTVLTVPVKQNQGETLSPFNIVMSDVHYLIGLMTVLISS